MFIIEKLQLLDTEKVNKYNNNNHIVWFLQNLFVYWCKKYVFSSFKETIIQQFRDKNCRPKQDWDGPIYNKQAAWWDKIREWKKYKITDNLPPPGDQFMISPGGERNDLESS